MHSVTRRTLLKTAVTTLGVSPVLSAMSSMGLFANETSQNKQRIWGILLHLGQNMWGDAPTAYTPPVDHFTCDEALWEELTQKSAESGLNMVVIDLGEAIQYQSHPELAIQGAWSVDRLRSDLERLRKIGIEPIPKLNFSTGHDFWLGEYARMVSTKPYYQVCSDLIKEVSELFDHPRFFHLGYDEENYNNQETYDYVVIRQGELWKKDFFFFIEQCEKNGVRPWIWGDYAWTHKDFYEWAPKSLIVSNWYYGNNFVPDENSIVKCYLELDANGFDQIPTGSNWANNENFGQTVEFCKKNISEEHLLGFLQTPWHFTEAKSQEHNLRAIQQVAEVIY